VNCPHDGEFHVEARVAMLTEVDDGPIVGYRFEAEVTCMKCNEPFAFIGLPPGMHSGQPTTDLMGRELRCPIIPASQALVIEIPGGN
jgi:hypothetical protein